ncbi:junctional cadherin 5-associated protein isoform X2 [Petromyzon marinus]
MEPPRSELEQGFPGQDVWHDAPPAPRATRHSSLPLQEHPARAEPSRERAELLSEKASYEEGQMQHQSPPVTIRNFENQLPLLEGSDESVSYWRRRGQDFSVLLDYTNHQPPQVDVSPPAYLAGLRDQPPSYNTVQHGPFNQNAVSREANPPPYPADSRDSTLPSEYSGLHGYSANAEALPRPSTYPQPPPYKAEPPTLELSQNSAPQTTQLQQSKINPDYALLTDQSKNMHRNSREKGNSKYVSSHCCSDYQDMSGMYYFSSQCGQDSRDMLVNPGKGSTSLQATSDAHAILYTGKQYFEATPLPTEKIKKPQTFRPPPPTYEMYQMRSKDCYKGPTTQVQLKNLCCHMSTHENGQYKSSAEFSPDRLFMPPESQMKYQNVQLPTYIKPPDYISQYKDNTYQQNQHASNENSIDSIGENKQKLRTARVEYIPFTDPRVRIVPKAHWETERQNQDNGHSVRKSTNDNNSVNYIQVKEGLDKQLLHSKQIPPPSLVLPVLNQDSYVWRNSQSNHEINKHKMHSDDITYMQLKYPDSTSTSADHAFHSRKGHIQETASEHRSVLHTDKKEGILQGDKTHEASGGQMPRSLLGVRTGVHQRGAVGETVFCLISVPSQSVDVDQGGIWLPDVSKGSGNAVPEHSHQHTQSASELELQALTGKMIAEEEARKAKEKAEEKAKKHACESQILSHPLKFSSELKGEAKMYDTRQKPLSQKHPLNNVTLHCVPKQLYPDERTFVSQKNRQIHGHAVEVEGKHFQASNCRWKTQNSQNTSHITGEKKTEEIKSEFGSKMNGKQMQILKEGNTKVSSKGNKSWQNRETGKRGTNCNKEKFNSKYFYKVKSLKEPTGAHGQAALEANTQVPTITLKGNSLADSFSFGQFLLRPVGRRPWDVVSELENINRELQDDPEEQDHDPSIQRPQDVYQRFHVLMPSGQKDELTHTLERRKSEPNLSELPSSQYERSHIAWGSKNSCQNVGDYSSPYSSDGSTTNKVEIDDDENEQNRIRDNLEKENLHFNQKGPSERLLHYNRSHGNDVYMSTPSSSLQRRHGHSEPDLTALIASQELGDEHEDQSELGFTSASLKESLAERAARILGISISEDALLAPDSSTATESKDALTMEFDGNFCDITTGTEKATHNSNNLFGEKKMLFINGYSENEHNETSEHGLQIKNKCDSHKDKLKKSLVILCKEELTSYTSTKLYESHTQEEMSPPKYANGNQPDRKTDDENTIRNQVICASGDQYNCNITGCIAEPRFYSSCSMIFSPIKMKSKSTIRVKHIEQSESPLIVENVCSMKGECEDCSDIPGCLCLVKDDGFVDSLSKHERRDRQLNECNRTALAEHAQVAWEYTDNLKAAASDSIKDNGHGLDVHGCLPLHVPTVKTNTEATNTLLALDVICS